MVNLKRILYQISKNLFESDNMKKKIGILSVFLGLAIIFFFFQGNSIDTKGRDELKENIITSLKNNPNQLDFNKVTNFKWDKVYIFHPYTEGDEISRQLGFKWKYPTNIEHSDSINLLVFVKDNRVFQYLELSRQYGDFIIIKNNKKTPTDSIIHLKSIK